MKDQEPQAIIIVDLGFGDTGKGSITDFLCRELPVHTVIRYNGGSQAGHNIITPDGRYHRFAQFSSGTFLPGIKTYLSRFVLIDPLSMLKEERHLQGMGVVDSFKRTSIDENSIIVTPFHQAINRLKEIARGDNRFGTTGTGVSEVALDNIHFKDMSLLVGDLPDRKKTSKKLMLIRQLQLNKLTDLTDNLPDTEDIQKDLFLLNQPQIQDYFLACSELYSHWVSQVNIVDGNFLEKVLKNPGTVIFEGAQGVLLDRQYGFYPYVTQSNTTAVNAEELLTEHNYQGKTFKMGLTRTYATRHGPGPFVTEDKTLTETIPDLQNTDDNWQGKFRVGFLDLVMLHYALEVTGKIDNLAVTHIDKLDKLPEWKVAVSYQTALGKKLNKIKKSSPPTPSSQQNLTKLLEGCNPQYKIIGDFSDPISYVKDLGEKINLPISILSFGPTANDKQWLDQAV